MLDLDSADYTDHELRNEKIMQAIYASSKSPIHQLASNILVKFWVGIFFIVPELAGIFLIDISLVHILPAIMPGAYALGAAVLYMEYTDLKRGVPMNMNLLINLRR